MRLATRDAFLVALGCLALQTPAPVAAPRKDEHQPEKVTTLAGDYFLGEIGGYVRLTLDMGGDFSFEWYTDDRQSVRYLGKADVVRGRLVLRPRDPHTEAALRVLVNGLLTTSHAATVPPGKPGTAAEQLSFVPVRWGGRVYLVAGKELLEFCNAVNLGMEPRLRSIGGRFLLRAKVTKPFLVGEEDPAVEQARGLPRVPGQWQPYLLRAPVQGNVISVLSHTRGRINLGRKDGILKDMELFVGREPRHGARVRAAAIARVLAVDADSSTVEVAHTRFFLAAVLEEGQVVLSRPNLERILGHFSP